MTTMVTKVSNSSVQYAGIPRQNRYRARVPGPYRPNGSTQHELECSLGAYTYEPLCDDEVDNIAVTVDIHGFDALEALYDDLVKIINEGAERRTVNDPRAIDQTKYNFHQLENKLVQHRPSGFVTDLKSVPQGLWYCRCHGCQMFGGSFVLPALKSSLYNWRT